MDLIEAIEADDPQTVAELLQAGAESQARGPNGYTPLMLAAARGRLQILELLLHNGADPEQRDGETAREGLKRFVHFAGKEQIGNEPLGHTALFAAARQGHAPIIERLLQAGADPNRRDFLDETPLHWAAENGHLEAVTTLLQGGSGADSKTLMAALENAHPECALALLEAGVPADQKALIQAAYLADAPVLQRMLALKPKLKAGKALAPVGYATRLMPAAEAPPGRWTTIFNEKGTFKRVPEPEDKILEAMEVLLQTGAPVNEISSVGPALYVAASNGLTRVARRLLEAGADPNLGHQNSTPLQVAQLMGHQQTAELLAACPHTPLVTPQAPKPRKAPKELKQPTFPKMPDLSELEKTCGSAATQPDYLRGGREIQLAHPVDLLPLQRHWLTKGIYLFHPRSPESLAAIPADHWRLAIALMQTNGANCDVHCADVLKFLETLEKTQPFELTTITHDRLEGLFTTPITNPKQMARKMYKFCPDLVDQGCGTLEMLAEELQKQPPRLYFWWD